MVRRETWKCDCRVSLLGCWTLRLNARELRQYTLTVQATARTPLNYWSVLFYKACNQSNQICGCFFLFAFFFFWSGFINCRKRISRSNSQCKFFPSAYMCPVHNLWIHTIMLTKRHYTQSKGVVSEFLFSLSVSTLLLLSIMRQKHHHPFIPVWNIQQLGRVMPHSKVCYSIGLSALSYAITDSLSFWSICFVTQPLKGLSLLLLPLSPGPTLPKSHEIMFFSLNFSWQVDNILTCLPTG